MKIDLPNLINFNKDKLAPSNEKLASFTVGQLPKNIMKPFMFISTSKLSVSYQKLRDRYEYLRRLEPLTPCYPKCQEGWYWDCDTETCKEYSSYLYEVINTFVSIEAISHETSYPYTGSGIVQSTLGTPPHHVYAFEKTNASYTYDGFYNTYVIETFSNRPKLEAFVHFQEYYYSSNEEDYLEYGIKNLPDYLVGKQSASGSNSNFIGEFIYSQKSNAGTRAGVNLFPDAYYEGALESWMQPALCGNDYVFVGTGIIDWKFKLYGVK